MKTFVRAHDVDHGLNLEKAGATAVSCLLPMIYQLVKVVLDFIFPTELMLSNNLQVVPETLEPSLQLAAAVLAQVNNLNVSIVRIISCCRISTCFSLVLCHVFCVVE